MASFTSLGLNQKHNFAEPLPSHCGLDSTAYWAFRTPDNLLIFVHGFWGDPSTTWHDFPGFLASEPVLAATDVISFGYNAKTNAANPSALAFLQFLEDIVANPSALVQATLGNTPRPLNHQYRSIIIVAHSLGAFVTRRALLWAAQKQHPWVGQVRMVLFAPAHHGAYAAVLASSYMTNNSDWWLGKLAGHAALYMVPLVQDLTPGSLVLNSLRDDTRAALATAGSGPVPGYLAAETVVWAQDDRVVINNPFERDPLPEQFGGKHHLNVCKPSHGFRNPLDVVIRALARA